MAIKIKSDLGDTSQVVIKRALDVVTNKDGIISEPNIVFDEPTKPWDTWFYKFIQFAFVLMASIAIFSLIACPVYHYLKMISIALFP